MMKEKIIEILKSRGYNDYSANLVSKELLELSGPLAKLFNSWVENENNQSDYRVGDYSVSSLQKERGMNYPAALLTLDWLMKEPEKAIRSLNKGRR